ncbi:MAG: class I SAM-dependent methyltransferase [Candidatus Omnitrophica bacterium]|nr:class I SAM-dependent methyltransferase [Candidatus Omnitrophota bacterium]
MAGSDCKKMIEAGLKAADSGMLGEDKIWSRYSHDKVDIGEELAKVIRTLSKALPLSLPMRALSIGSSSEPQFRILETAFRGGLYLLDVDKKALDTVRERLARQCTTHVMTIRDDYNKEFLNAGNTERFLKKRLGGRKVNLITLHHSLYYSKECEWAAIFENLYRKILAPKGAMHAVLMASCSGDNQTTTWLYNHFAGKFCGCRNDQDMYVFKKELDRNPVFKNSGISIETHKVRFCVNDFANFMAVVWMLLLYPDVHKYTLKQREEITEFILNRFWLKKKPLIQAQDHLIVYKGIGLT